jgi:hypothetical protein
LSGLFIPEQWSMPPFIDDFGNSKVKEALEAILVERAEWKIKLNPEQYQLRISQKPTNIAEGFAYRKESIFPQGIIQKQLKKIEDKEYHYEHIELERTHDGIKAKRTSKLPISTFLKIQNGVHIMLLLTPYQKVKLQHQTHFVVSTYIKMLLRSQEKHLKV